MSRLSVVKIANYLSSHSLESPGQPAFNMCGLHVDF
ncbi:hypothetical protein AWB78_04919 [Caballeronia calidae]|uniref:Uncharacterized protein n=1 Tax=Caballeronia calidae TaxID=1777139 RepID=A0A158DA87_9BURK|nr:hypothetical protein AWB78_04919 [Caballeronia calidae]